MNQKIKTENKWTEADRNSLKTRLEKIRRWTQEESATMVKIIDGGGLWAEAVRAVDWNHNSCKRRYDWVKEQEAKEKENTLLAKSIRYLQQRGFVIFPKGENYLVGTHIRTAADLIIKAATHKTTTDLLARTAQ